MAIDFWPDVSELGESERFPTSLTNPDGSTAQLFSSHNARTVSRHFEWMRDYHIAGAFIQRFAAPIIRRDAASRTHLRATDDVLNFARSAAERYGRSIAIMYDLSGMPSGRMAEVIADWKHLVDDLGIRNSSAYQFHDGHPVVAIWGVGFNDDRRYTLQECEGLIDFLKNDPVYGGNTVMLGIPTGWREQTGDAVSDPHLHAVLKKADILSPWTPGRYRDLADARIHLERVWLPDRAWCDAHHLAYMPVVFPGFSWRNLKQVDDFIDRLDGRFLWEQYRQLLNHGFLMVYQAMFDEMNEGTQIFKTTNSPPREARFATYAPLPPDYYLRLVERAADNLVRNQPMPEVIENVTGRKDIALYLHQRDPDLYAAATDSYSAQHAFREIADQLVAHAPGWTPVDDNEGSVSVSGVWQSRYTFSTDPNAAVAWRFSVLRPGIYRVRIRYPVDSDRSHAANAVLTVNQDGVELARTRLDLRTNGLAWNDTGAVRFLSGASCQITLSNPDGSGALVLAEPELLAVDDGSFPSYRVDSDIPYCTVDGKVNTLNAFLPSEAGGPVAAMVDIHGGWWSGGKAASRLEGVGGWRVFTRRKLAIFSINYRLGAEGGFPENIRDCRNAIRFIRKNAARFNIDPERIGVCGGSAGGHLSLMVAMVPEDFDDGGPTPGLEGVSARVCDSFSYIPPTDFVRFWNEGPTDVVVGADGKTSFRGTDDKISNDSRPHFRVLFHGITPDTETHQALYARMCPIGQVRREIPPLLICDGESDPIVPRLEGKELYERLVAAGAPATYWMTPRGGHGFPGGAGFEKILDDFVVRTLKLPTVPLPPSS